MKPRILTLRIKAIYWQQIDAGTKSEELRIANPRYIRQLLTRDYDVIHIWLGYPPATDTAKLLRFAWRGAKRIRRQADHFGPTPVDLIAVDLSVRIP
jgi:hypothetical protein